MLVIPRILSEKIKANAASYPVVAIVGPRQSGKTTLVRECFPNRLYRSLEDLDIREFAEQDPRGFLNQMPDGGIIDEIQRVPHLLSYIQTIVDQTQKPGMFILTGSNQFVLVKKVSQSLAGRISLLRLMPFTISELTGTSFENLDLEEFIYRGMYPRIYDHNLNPTEWYLNYVDTYLERDLKDFIQVKDLSLFRRFLTIVASNCARICNRSSISNALGISHNTVQAWLSALEMSYIIFMLQPYHRNYKKRVVKTPKLYFYDTGLVCTLLRIRQARHLKDHIITGQLFENMVVSELHKESMHRGMVSDFYFWKDHTGHEVDCLYDDGRYLFPIEIKLSQTIHNDFFRGLNYFTALSGNDPSRATIIYGGAQTQKRFEMSVFRWRDISLLAGDILT